MKESNNLGVSNNIEKFIEMDKNISLYKDELKNKELDNTEKINKLQQFILSRKDNMIANKSGFQNDIGMADLAFESKSDLLINGVPFFNYPLEKSIVGILESELGEKDIVYKLEANGTKSDVNKIKPNQIIMDWIYSKDNTSKKMKIFRKHFFKYGMGVVFEGIDIKKKKIRSENKEFDGKFLTGDTLETKDTFEMGLNSRIVHPSNFYIDSSVINFDEANDCIEIEKVGKYDILNRFNGEEFFNKDKMVNSLDDNDNTIIHYYNESEDLYGILINDVLIYTGPNPYPHKLLPYSIAVLQESDKTPYGEGGIVKLLRFAKPYLNEIFNITIQQSKNSNQSPLLLGNGNNFDGQEPTFGVGKVWKFSGSLSEVREMKVSPPDTSIFNIITIIQDLIVQLIGIDPRSIYSKSTKTKFEAGLVEEAKNKRISTFGKTLDYAYTNFLNMRLKNAHYFLSVMSVEDIVDPNNIKKLGYKKILLKDTEITNTEDGGIDFNTLPGAYSEFEMKPEYIRGDFSVNVITESTRPLLKEIEKEDILNIVRQVQSMAQTNPEIVKDVNFKKLLEILFTKYNMDMDELMPDTQSQRIADKISKLKEQMLSATANLAPNPQEQMMSGIVNGVQTQPTPPSA